MEKYKPRIINPRRRRYLRDHLYPGPRYPHKQIFFFLPALLILVQTQPLTRLSSVSERQLLPDKAVLRAVTTTVRSSSVPVTSSPSSYLKHTIVLTPTLALRVYESYLIFLPFGLLACPRLGPLAALTPHVHPCPGSNSLSEVLSPVFSHILHPPHTTRPPWFCLPIPASHPHLDLTTNMPS